MKTTQLQEKLQENFIDFTRTSSGAVVLDINEHAIIYDKEGNERSDTYLFDEWCNWERLINKDNMTVIINRDNDMFAYCVDGATNWVIVEASNIDGDFTLSEWLIRRGCACHTDIGIELIEENLKKLR